MPTEFFETLQVSEGRTEVCKYLEAISQIDAVLFIVLPVLKSLEILSEGMACSLLLPSYSVLAKQ